jgi:hypothetical protein
MTQKECQRMFIEIEPHLWSAEATPQASIDS